MLKKGTARPFKKILGWILIIVGVVHIANIQQVLSMLEPYKIFVGVVMAIAGYLLVISGRQL